MRNLELKARDVDPKRSFERALTLGAEDRGELAQRDTYFGHARGRLKLREQSPGGAELIEYRRADSRKHSARPSARGPDTEEPCTSAYRIVPVSEAEALHDALAAALGMLVVVTKKRRLLLWNGVRIHLDEVEGLGDFVELEAVAEPGSDLTTEKEKLEHVRADLGIEEAELVAASYSDLLLDTPETLLRAAEAAMRNAHAPYSGFRVGAALRTPAGSTYVGANVENAAYPQGQCAEASALGALVAAGERDVAAVAVVAERVELCPPCGGCRQRLMELARPETPVHLGRPGGARRTLTLGELLPLAFGLEHGDK
jgi:homotetrameric cytidine deaminase